MNHWNAVSQRLRFDTFSVSLWVSRSITSCFNLLTRWSHPVLVEPASYDSYHRHEEPDMRVNNTNILSAPKRLVTSALKMSCPRGMAPEESFSDTIGLTQESRGLFPPSANRPLSWPLLSKHLWMEQVFCSHLRTTDLSHSPWRGITTRALYLVG